MMLKLIENKDWTYKGIPISQKVEDKQNHDLVTVSVRAGGKTYGYTANVPTPYRLYGYLFGVSVYANPIYAVPSPDYYGFPAITGIDVDSVDGNGTGNYILHVPSEDAYFETFSSIMQKTAGISENFTVWNMDTWKYCRASDVFRKIIEEDTKNLIDNLLDQNRWDTHQMRRHTIVAMQMFRYVDHVRIAKEWMIDHASNEVILPPVFAASEVMGFARSNYLDFSDCPQSKTFQQFSLRSGAYLCDGKLTVSGELGLFSSDKRDVAFVKYMDGKRRIVSRSRLKAMELVSPEIPVVYGKSHHPFVDSVTLRTVRFYAPETLNDSCVISKEALLRVKAYRTIAQTIRIPSDASIEWKIQAAKDPAKANDELKRPKRRKHSGDHSSSIENFVANRSDLPETITEWLAVNSENSDAPCTARRYQIIANVTVTATSGETRVDRIRTNVRLSCGMVVIAINEEPSIDPDIRVYSVLYRAIVPAGIGDKFMTQTGHKFTIGKILPESEMPVVDGYPADILIPFEIGKRCTPSVWLEEILSRAWFRGKIDDVIDIVNRSQTAKEMYDRTVRLGIDETADVSWRGIQFKAPYGYIRIYRTCNLPDETIKWSAHDIDSPKYDHKQSVKITWNMIQLLSDVGAHDLVKWMCDRPGKNNELNSRFNQLILGLTGDAANGKTVNVFRSLPADIAFGITVESRRFRSLSSVDLAGTVLDPQIRSDMLFGKIATFDSDGNQVWMVIPPLAAVLHVGSDDRYIVGKALLLANRIVEITNSYKSCHTESGKSLFLNDLSRAISGYVKVICDMLQLTLHRFGNPEVDNSMYAVASSNPNLNAGEVGIPDYIFRHYERTNPVFAETKSVMLFRQPVHTACSMLGMKAVSVSSKTIQINPAVIDVLRGDFDGDAVFVVFPNDMAAARDIEKISTVKIFNDPDYWNRKTLLDRIYESYDLEFSDKTLKSWERDFSILNSNEEGILGISSWPGNMQFETPSENFESMWSTPMTRDQILANSLLAGKCMSMIKTATAHAGGMGLSFIAWLQCRNLSARDRMLGPEFYRMVAEDALSNKSGNTTETEDLFRVYTFARCGKDGIPADVDSNEVNRIMSRLLAKYDSNGRFTKLPKLFCEFLDDKSKSSTVHDFNLRISPLYALLRHNSSIRTVRKWMDAGRPLKLTETKA